MPSMPHTSRSGPGGSRSRPRFLRFQGSGAGAHHNDKVTLVQIEPSQRLEQTPVPVPVSVITGALLVACWCGVPLVGEFPREATASGAALPLLAWLSLGFAGVALLDRRPRSPVGWAAVVATATPLVVMGIGYLWPDGNPGTPQMLRLAAEQGPLTLAALVLPALASLLPWPGSRGDRRWRLWIVAACAVALGVACLAWFIAPPAAYGAAAAAGIGLVALVIGVAGFAAEPRPVVEPLVDLGLCAAGLVLAAGVGAAVLQFARHEQIIAPEALSALATAATLALTLPGAWWLRREFLTRRYGSGVLSADEIATLTADLKATADPRELLTKACAMITASSGVAEARLVLDAMDAPDGWDSWPLLVGDELVGTLLLLPSHPGGLEVRQARVCRQLLPTIALVARAVVLAVDAGYARTDAAHQRELERSRILADLHDDLGPVLAGMSMRVQAARETHHLRELDVLAADLASCRADLRRIVSGLGPTALDDGDVRSAITALVASFNSGPNPRVVLRSDIPESMDGHAAVLIYRAIAEGTTNAIKHAGATEVRVSLERQDDRLCLCVTDNGAGGPVIPGVGLESLRSRASEIGGTLVIESAHPTGTRLSITIPDGGVP